MFLFNSTIISRESVKNELELLNWHYCLLKSVTRSYLNDMRYVENKSATYSANSSRTTSLSFEKVKQFKILATLVVGIATIF